jgi:multidrug efflux system membrane fusion protein
VSDIVLAAIRQKCFKLFTGVAIAVFVVLGGWVANTYVSKGAAAQSAPPPPPQVVVSKPVVRELALQEGFLGQFSAVQQVELRAQVGGTLTGIFFRDGDLVQKGKPLFSIDQRPYEIKLASAKAELESAQAKLALANRELVRAQDMKREDAGSMQNVDQRTADQSAAQAAVDAAQANIRDAQFDIEHCNIAAPFTGRIGAHLISVGNLIAGSRSASSPTTLLATLVSLDPIYLNFDMSESDYIAFSQRRAKQHGALAEKVKFELSGETKFDHAATLDFVDNILDRSSGTLHARATVPNPDFLLTPGEFARLTVSLGAPSSTLLVPDSSVVPDQSENFVLIVAPDGTVVPKRVSVGDMRGGLRVVAVGLAPTDRVIIDGIPNAVPASKVSPKDGAIQFSGQAED